MLTEVTSFSNYLKTFEILCFFSAQIRALITEIFNDVVQADVGANDAAQQSNNEDEGVLGQAPLEVPGFVPVGGQVYQGRCHDAQGGHLDGAQQGDEQI